MKLKITHGIWLVVCILSSLNLHSQPPPGSGWTNVFADEFGGSSINTNIWRVRNDNAFKPSQLNVSGGTLKINNSFTGNSVSTGGWIESIDQFAGNNRYGYYEARIRIVGPDRGDIWPTWWIWGKNFRNGAPGPSGTEFDLMEYSGFGKNFFGGATSSHHYFDKQPINGVTNITTDRNSTEQRNAFQWHRWGLHWTPNRITFYYDNVPYFVSEGAGATDAANDPFPLFLILSSSPHTRNIQGVNQDFGGFQPSNLAQFAAVPGRSLAFLEVDWVRVWRGGTIGNTGGGTDTGVTIKGQSINQFISSENGNGPMNCNRPNAQAWERFTIQSTGIGQVTIKGSNGKYVSSENGNNPMTCNRTNPGAWEKFTLVSQGGNVYAIKGNNGKYVSHENGSGPMTCNRPNVGAWEKFIFNGLNNNKSLSIQKLPSKNEIAFFPNPGSSDNLNLRISLSEKISNATLKIVDITGKTVAYKKLGALPIGANAITLDEIKGSLQSGLYMARIALDSEIQMTKLVIK